MTDAEKIRFLAERGMKWPHVERGREPAEGPMFITEYGRDGQQVGVLRGRLDEDHFEVWNPLTDRNALAQVEEAVRNGYANPRWTLYIRNLAGGQESLLGAVDTAVSATPRQRADALVLALGGDPDA